MHTSSFCSLRDLRLLCWPIDHPDIVGRQYRYYLEDLTRSVVPTGSHSASGDSSILSRHASSLVAWALPALFGLVCHRRFILALSHSIGQHLSVGVVLGKFGISNGRCGMLCISYLNRAFRTCLVYEYLLLPLSNLSQLKSRNPVSTEKYQAQYRVLEAFSLFNAILRASTRLTTSIDPLNDFCFRSLGFPSASIAHGRTTTLSGRDSRVVLSCHLLPLVQQIHQALPQTACPGDLAETKRRIKGKVLQREGLLCVRRTGQVHPTTLSQTCRTRADGLEGPEDTRQSARNRSP